MVFKAHVRNGAIWPDEAVALVEGAEIYVSIASPSDSSPRHLKYRGLPYRYDEPFEPAIPPEHWEANQ